MVGFGRIAGAFVLAVGLAGCSTAAATPNAPAAGTSAPSGAAVTTAQPSGGSGATSAANQTPTTQPQVTSAATPTLPPAKATVPNSTLVATASSVPPPAKPDLVTSVPVLTPASPVCNTDFVVDVDITNGGGPMAGAAELALTAVRQKDGYIGLKKIYVLPIIAPGSSIHLRNTVRIDRYMTYDMMAFADAKFWVAESREDNNEVHKVINVLKGTCAAV